MNNEIQAQAAHITQPSTHVLTYLAFAFIAMTGLSYLNFLPSVVNALAGDIGFCPVEAGHIVAMNGYGGIIGSLFAVFLIRRIRWQPAMRAFMALLLFIEMSTVLD